MPSKPIKNLVFFCPSKSIKLPQHLHDKLHTFTTKNSINFAIFLLGGSPPTPVVGRRTMFVQLQLVRLGVLFFPLTNWLPTGLNYRSYPQNNHSKIFISYKFTIQFIHRIPPCFSIPKALIKHLSKHVKTLVSP